MADFYRPIVIELFFVCSKLHPNDPRKRFDVSKVWAILQIIDDTIDPFDRTLQKWDFADWIMFYWHVRNIASYFLIIQWKFIFIGRKYHKPTQHNNVDIFSSSPQRTDWAGKVYAWNEGRNELGGGSGIQNLARKRETRESEKKIGGPWQGKREIGASSGNETDHVLPHETARGDRTHRHTWKQTSMKIHRLAGVRSLAFYSRDDDDGDGEEHVDSRHASLSLP